MISIELLINIVVRGALGLFLAAVFSFGLWWLSWVSFSTSDLSLPIFFLVQASIIGGAASVPTVLAWWNTQSSQKVQLLSIGLTVGAAVASAWLYNEIQGIETHKALVGGVLRVSVFSLSHMQTSMIVGAVFGGNAVAATLYLYRALRHREV